jgi:hypothetical protein
MREKRRGTIFKLTIEIIKIGASILRNSHEFCTLLCRDDILYFIVACRYARTHAYITEGESE